MDAHSNMDFMCSSGVWDQLHLIDSDKLAQIYTLPFNLKNLIGKVFLAYVPKWHYSFVAVIQWELDSVGAGSLPLGCDSSSYKL